MYSVDYVWVYMMLLPPDKGADAGTHSTVPLPLDRPSLPSAVGCRWQMLTCTLQGTRRQSNNKCRTKSSSPAPCQWPGPWLCILPGINGQVAVSALGSSCACPTAVFCLGGGGGSMVGIDRLNVPAIDNFSPLSWGHRHGGHDEGITGFR